ncbi:MAG: endonuclease/exonuclease/phosphatase family protein [Limnobacter sp.]|nr:endonuclease/exonuclease/phosphatase family protein [Limnobacter sp.]
MFEPLLIASYNTRWACNARGEVDTSRIARAISANGAPDVVCLQEVSVGPTGLQGTDHAPNQVAEYLRHFPEHRGFFAPSVSRTFKGKPAHFGNLTLTRLPAEQVRYETLPSPLDDSDKPWLPRNAIVTTLVHESIRFTVLNTHLEYYNPQQRWQQAQYLRDLCASLQKDAPPVFDPQEQDQQTDPIFLRGQPGCPLIICGDLNCTPESEEIQTLCNGIEGLPTTLNNVWSTLEKPRTAIQTVGLHDGYDWPDHAYCCDYFIMSESLMPNLVEAWVDTETDASDHQPIFMRLNANPHEEPPAFI